MIDNLLKYNRLNLCFVRKYSKLLPCRSYALFEIVIIFSLRAVLYATYITLNYVWFANIHSFPHPRVSSSTNPVCSPFVTITAYSKQLVPRK